MLCSFTKKDPVGRRRRNSFFVSGVSKAQMITLQISGLLDKVSTAIVMHCVCLDNVFFTAVLFQF